jgi:hypothetical protein
MLLAKVLLASLACAVVGPFGASAFAASPERCAAPKSGSDAAPIFSPAFSDVVTGSGRLQFYSAPNVHCATPGVFVVPGDTLVEYARTNDGWSSVTYFSGSGAEGWVRSARLKQTGTVGPQQ